MNAHSHYVKMTRTPVSKLIVLLGIPTTISMLITSIYNIVDNYYIGLLGISEQGACGILFSLQAIIQAIAFMLGHGSGAFVSKALADKNTKEASTYISTAFYIGVTLSLLLTIFGLIFLEPFMYLLGSTDTILPHAKAYGFWVLLSCPFMVGSLVLNNNLRYEGQAIFSMFGLVAGGLLNIFGDYLFMFVLHLGVFGAGLSTCISQIISFIILLVAYIVKAQSKIRLKYISTSIMVYLNIFRVGLPSLIRQGLTSISSGILNNLANDYADAGVTAMSNINRFSSLIMCVGLGIGQGYQPVASFNYQAKEYDRVKKGLTFTMLFGLVFVSILGAIGILTSDYIAYFLQQDISTLDITSRGIKIACFGVIFLSLSVPVNMLYQSIRKSFIASILSMLRSGILFIPSMLILAHFFKYEGLLWAQACADILTAIVCIPFVIYFLKKCPSTPQIEENKNLQV